MTEKEKMLKGEPYKAFGEELFGERQYAKEMLFEFNSLHPGEIETRNEIIKNLFGNVSENSFIEPPFRGDYGRDCGVMKKPNFSIYREIGLFILEFP